MKRGKQPILYAVSSIVSWMVDTGVFFVLELLFGAALGVYGESVFSFGARAVSSFLNFNLNNRLVFGNTGSYWRAMLRYYCLAVPQLIASAALVTLFVQLLKAGDNAYAATAVKIAVDGCLFVASFFIQKYWVFRKKEEPAGETSAKK